MTELNENLGFSEKAIQAEIELQKTLSPEENAERYLTLKRKSGIDPLTGLKNKEAITEEITSIESILKRLNDKYCVLFVDVDNLKQVNDTKGHDKGNEVIVNVANSLVKTSLRKSDKVGRWTKGDEFIVFLEGMNDQTSYSYRERLLETIKENGALSDISLSIGAATCDFSKEKEKTFLDVVNEADKAMYKSKEAKGKRIGQVGMIFYNEISNNEQK
jgi:diguanylate cyclase